MNILADENVEAPIVAFLRSQAHDVLSASESFASTPDLDVLARGNAEGRVLITNDLDFGELIYHRKLQTLGILLLRFKTKSLAEKVALFQAHWPAAARELPGHFIVMSSNSLRIRPLRP